MGGVEISGCGNYYRPPHSRVADCDKKRANALFFYLTPNIKQDTIHSNLD